MVEISCIISHFSRTNFLHNYGEFILVSLTKPESQINWLQETQQIIQVETPFRSVFGLVSMDIFVPV